MLWFERDKSLALPWLALVTCLALLWPTLAIGSLIFALTMGSVVRRTKRIVCFDMTNGNIVNYAVTRYSFFPVSRSGHDVGSFVIRTGYLIGSVVTHTSSMLILRWLTLATLLVVLWLVLAIFLVLMWLAQATLLSRLTVVLAKLLALLWLMFVIGSLLMYYRLLWPAWGTLLAMIAWL